jgi:hypothetical protein
MTDLKIKNTIEIGVSILPEVIDPTTFWNHQQTMIIQNF